MKKDSATTAPRRQSATARKSQPRPSSQRPRAAGLRPRSAGSKPALEPKAVATKFTFHVNPTLALICLPPDASALFSLEIVADLTGVHAEMLRYYCRQGLLGGERIRTAQKPTFDEEALHDVRRIEHYRRDLAVSRRALPLVCELWRQAERQQIAIQFMRCP